MGERKGIMRSLERCRAHRWVVAGRSLGCLSRELNLPFLLGLEQIPDAHGDRTDRLGDAGSQDRAPSDRGNGGQRSRCDKYCAQCRHGSRVLHGQEVERVAGVQ